MRAPARRWVTIVCACVPRGEEESLSDQAPGMQRRTLLRNSALAGGGAALAAALAACGKSSDDNSSSSDSGAAAKGGAGNFPVTPKWKFVFVNHVTTNPFFTPTQYGIEDASALVNTTFQWTGSKTADVSEMVNSMNAAISAKADGIAVCLVDQKAFNGPTDQALQAGIPVISYDADTTGNNRLAYIGQDLFLSGVEMGKRIVELVPSGKVGLFIATPGSLNIQPRIDGAIDSIKKSGKDIEYKTVATSAELNEELSRIDAWYLGNKDAKGMFAVDAGSTQAVAQVIQKYKLRDKGMKGGGYDLLPKTLELLKADQLDFTIDQQAYLQGFFPVMQLFLVKLSGTLTGPGDMNTGLKFLTKEDASIYLGSPSRFEGSTKDQKVIQAA
jgi:simple sugar transport system substrate-binding protein